jgi:hypothetical protein
MAVWVKPTLDTKLHIDFDWWKEKGADFRVVLQSRLCSDCQVKYGAMGTVDKIDWIDPDTAEITQVDGLWHSLRTCCSQRSDYITEQTPMVEAAFRVFLANDNTPLTPRELSQVIGKGSPDAILRALASRQVYMGIKPVVARVGRPKKEK